MITSVQDHGIPAHRGWILTACMLAMFMAAVEVTIVATAMPTIVTDLGGFASLGWVFAVYLLMQAITVPIYGRLADLYGRKPVFFFGIGLFLAGSALCGFAHTMVWLIMFRALQGLGAGAITPLTTTIVADIYPPHLRARAQGYLASVWAVSAIIGPLLGAFIVEHYRWAGVFWVNLPLGMVSLLLLGRYLPSGDNDQPSRALDSLGISYLSVSIGALLLTILQSGQFGLWSIPLLILSLLSGFLFVRQQTTTVSPLFPPALWRSRTIVAGNIGGLAIGAAMMGISAFLPAYIQAVMGGGALAAGWTLAVMSLGWPLASVLSGRIMHSTSYRFTAVTGALFLMAGSGLLLLLTPHSSLWFARVAAFIIGVGMGMSSTTFLVSVQNEADFSMRGIATASTMFTRMLGSALGTALLGATLNFNLRLRLPTIGDPMQLLIARQEGSGAGISDSDLPIIVQQVGLSLHWVFVLSAGLAFCALFSAWGIPRHTKPLEEGESRS